MTMDMLLTEVIKSCTPILEDDDVVLRDKYVWYDGLPGDSDVDAVTLSYVVDMIVSKQIIKGVVVRMWHTTNERLSHIELVVSKYGASIEFSLREHNSDFTALVVVMPIVSFDTQFVTWG